MAKIFLVPIEPFEERYSNQWYQWFWDEFNNSHTFESCIAITPDTEELRQGITDGQFLDVLNTNHFKAGQIQKIIKLIQKQVIKSGDILFFLDYWFPGVEALAYIRQGMGIDFKIAGCLHAGTWDKHDFLSQKGMATWGEHIENAWLEIADVIFVATEFHKRLITNLRKVTASHTPLIPTGFPIYEKSITGQEGKEFHKGNCVVFPHRLAKEKNPEWFDILRSEEICKQWENIPDDTTFSFSKVECQSKYDYYELLKYAKIAVSFAYQETWGIAMQESVLCGCYPIVPDRLSYSEMYLDVFKYRDLDGKDAAEEVCNRIDMMFSFPKIYRDAWKVQKQMIKNNGELAIKKMIVEMATRFGS